MLLTDRAGSVAMPELMPWDVFTRRIGWRQGEHMTFIGQTGQGKTTLAMQLLPLRRYVVVIATKPRDPIIRRAQAQGFKLVRDWPVVPEIHPRVVYWPKIERMEDQATQAHAIAECLENIYETGGWTVYLDEIRYIAEPAYLGLRSHVQLLWTQARSLGVSVVGGTQRPAWVPLEAYSQATHLFFWRETDDANLKRVASMAGVRSNVIRTIVPQLPNHHALYINTVTGAMTRTVAPEKG